MKKPSDHYKNHLKENNWSATTQQLQVITALDYLQQHILQEQKTLWTKIIKKTHLYTPPKGLYCWGPVGRGKSFVMDCFIQSLPSEMILRQHFHAFMLDMHNRLYTTSTINPIRFIAKKMAKQYKVIYLDEFLVDNIADAMILKRILIALKNAGICLITNSNTKPSALYEGGLHRARFIPAIDFIQKNMHVISLEDGTDYRAQKHDHHNFIVTDRDQQFKYLKECFYKQTGINQLEARLIDIYGRNVMVIAENIDKKIIWIDFDQLCHPPRSAKDYLWITQHYHQLFISGVRAILPHEHDQIINWIKLIDICYDHKLAVIITSTVPLDELYTGGRILNSYQRTYSRLQEMQSEDFSPHSFKNDS